MSITARIFPFPLWNFKQFQGRVNLSMYITNVATNPIGFTNNELVNLLGKDNYKYYNSWARGKTVGVDKNGQTLNYSHDIDKFLYNVGYSYSLYDITLKNL